jgi:hypothetical protein
MSNRGTVAVIALLAVGAAGITPALAAPAKHKPKPIKGTWSFVDTTPDPSATAEAQQTGTDPYCHGGNVPPSPVDKNSYTLKIKGPGALTVTGSNTLDWAMELNDSKGHMLAASDGGLPQDEEGVVASLKKPGSYTVVFCNLGGAPTADATYQFIYR